MLLSHSVSRQTEFYTVLCYCTLNTSEDPETQTSQSDFHLVRFKSPERTEPDEPGKAICLCTSGETCHVCSGMPGKITTDFLR